MSNCSINNISAESENKNPSVLYETLLKITGIDVKADDLYAYFKAPSKDLKPELYSDFISRFGNYKDAEDNRIFAGRLDENGEPKLYYSERLNRHFFLDKYYQKVFFPFEQQGLDFYLDPSNIEDVVQGITTEFITNNLKFDVEANEIVNKYNKSLSPDYILEEINKITKELSNGNRLQRTIGAKLKATVINNKTGDVKIENLNTWKNKINLYLKKLSIDTKTEELENNVKLQEESANGDLIRVESFLKDYKDNVNNSVKLLLSTIKSNRKNS
jgi:hypothetical protein